MGRKKIEFLPIALTLAEWVDNEQIHIRFYTTKALRIAVTIKNLDTCELIRLQKRISRKLGKTPTETWLVIRGFGGTQAREIRPSDETVIMGFADVEAGR